MKKSALIILFLLVVEFFSFVQVFANTNIMTDIVYVDGDNGFSPSIWSGSGSQNDPFVLSNCRITDNPTLFAIFIQNTNKYFIIENCVLARNRAGIVIKNADNGVIRHNHIFGNNQDGIALSQVQNVNISNNVVTGNTRYGLNAGFKNLYFNVSLVTIETAENRQLNIYKNDISSNSDGLVLNKTNYNNIIDNDINYNYQNGMYLKSSIKNNMSDNNIQFDGTGIKLEYSPNNLIENNTINFADSSISIYRSNYLIICGNDVLNDYLVAIQAKDSNASYIELNNINFNRWGIQFDNCNNASIVYNYFINNSEYAVFLNFLSNSNNISFNNFIDNQWITYQGSGTKQAYDNSGQNTWSNNYWSDLGSSTTYALDPASNTAKDNSPSPNQIDLSTRSCSSTFNNNPPGTYGYEFLSILIIPLVIVIKKKRIKK